MRQSMEDMATPVASDIDRKDFAANGIGLCHIAAPEGRQDRGVLYLQAVAMCSAH
jgi:hypothetical protein